MSPDCVLGGDSFLPSSVDVLGQIAATSPAGPRRDWYTSGTSDWDWTYGGTCFCSGAGGWSTANHAGEVEKKGSWFPTGSTTFVREP